MQTDKNAAERGTFEVGALYEGVGGPYLCMQEFTKTGEYAVMLERIKDHLVFVAHKPRLRENGSITWDFCSSARWLRTEL